MHILNVDVHSFWEEKKNPKKTVKTIAHDLRRKTWYPVMDMFKLAHRAQLS